MFDLNPIRALAATLRSRSAYRAVEVDVSSTAFAPVEPTRSIYIGTAGNLEVTMADGSKATFTNVAAGYHPLCVKIIHTTGDGTTATGIVALW